MKGTEFLRAFDQRRVPSGSIWLGQKGDHTIVKLTSQKVNTIMVAEVMRNLPMLAVE